MVKGRSYRRCSCGGCLLVEQVKGKATGKTLVIYECEKCGEKQYGRTHVSSSTFKPA
ncbi:hypothetical protein [Escherichia phage Lidtsur]|uniref:Uncharacterized protein n=1 Tax=Escherichia phage Lidtsur TaxID=2562235 RepID=A0A4D6DZ23_9CAUD|nr:hypothetical protein HOV34_gp24 [Escherichia phage Lidtsur]QBZ71528.1 hypothetical protein [Escherichia phage Lidtsur]